MQVMTHVGQKLQQIHSAGFAHRDVKPSNVIMNLQTKQWVLTDFASTAPIGAQKPLSFSILFAPPEIAAVVAAQQRTSVVSSAADVWALGIMAWTLLTGRLPYAHGVEIMPKLLGEQIFPWEQRLDQETEYKLGILEPSVRSMLERDPTQRATINNLLLAWRSLFQIPEAGAIPISK